MKQGNLQMPSIKEPDSSEETNENVNEENVSNSEIEKKEEEEEDLTAVNQVGEFLNYTTAHGLGRFAAAHGYGKVIWIAFLIGTYIGFTVHLSVLVNRFLQKPMLTAYDPKQEYKFPDIYICPKDPVSISKIVEPLTLLERWELENMTKHYDTNTIIQNMFVQHKFPRANQLLQFNILESNIRLTKKILYILEAIKRIQKKIMEELFIHKADLTTCRVTEDGSEYQGSVREVSAVVMNDNKEDAITKYPCIPWLEAADIIQKDNANIDSKIRSYVTNKEDNRCRAFPNLSYKHISGLSNYTLKNVLYGNIKFQSGPFCFFYENATVKNSTLLAHPCGIGFCARSPEFDCDTNWPEDTLSQRYTGTASTSQTGETCSSWDALKLNTTIFADDYFEKTEAEYRRSYLFYPDSQPLDSNKDKRNFCRVADLYKEQVAIMPMPIKRVCDPDCRFIQQYAETTFWESFIDCSTKDCKPVCPVLKTLENELKLLFFETCQIDNCNDYIHSIVDAISNNIEKYVLQQHIGQDFEMNLAKCDIDGENCTFEDFLTMSHPYLGTCYKFQHQKFTKNKPYSDLAKMKLSIILMTDATDANGRSYENTTILNNILKFLPFENTMKEGFKVFVLQKDEFPHVLSEADGITVSGGLKTELIARYDIAEKYPGLGCLPPEEEEQVTYYIPHWNTTAANNDAESQLKDEATKLLLPIIKDNETWSTVLTNLKTVLLDQSEINKKNITLEKTFASTEQNCINQYILDRFIKNCKCLPSFLPIPVKLMKSHKLCFTGTFNLIDTELCYKTEVDRLDSSVSEASKICRKRCVIPKYSIRTITTPWPEDHLRQTMLELKEITAHLGYPKKFQKWKGPTNLYYSYLQSVFLANDKTESRTHEISKFLVTSRVVTSGLASISVQGSSAYGQRVVEEEAYPLKNLAADFGGLLGLWSGISILTICEMIELLCFLCAHIKRKIKKANSVKYDFNKNASQSTMFTDIGAITVKEITSL